MNEAKLNPRQKMVQFMRGYYTLPIISFLGQKGILDQWCKKEEISLSYTLEKLPGILPIIEYLTSIDLLILDQMNNSFKISELGQKVFSRHGGFNILHSYHSYFENLEGVLTQNGSDEIRVERNENIYGSGQVHKKKYFKDALKLIDKEYTTNIDIACGNGEFIQELLHSTPSLENSIGVDLSSDSVKTANKRFANNNIVQIIQSDGLNVTTWSSEIKNTHRDFDFLSNGIISMWFFLHEISKGEINGIIELFKNLRLQFPNNDILICENVMLDPEDLRGDCDMSMAPEFLLFHKLSRQGVLSWSQYQEVLEKIPYSVYQEHLYDEVGVNGTPSSFIWLLEPKK